MVVIADTSPLNYLVLIGHVDVLPKLYGRVVVPQAVVEELLHPKTPVVVSSWIVSRPAWLFVEEHVPVVPNLPENLDPGERAAIALAEQVQPDAL